MQASKRERAGQDSRNGRSLQWLVRMAVGKIGDAVGCPGYNGVEQAIG